MGRMVIIDENDINGLERLLQRAEERKRSMIASRMLAKAMRVPAEFDDGGAKFYDDDDDTLYEEVRAGCGVEMRPYHPKCGVVDTPKLYKKRVVLNDWGCGFHDHYEPINDENDDDVEAPFFDYSSCAGPRSIPRRSMPSLRCG